MFIALPEIIKICLEDLRQKKHEIQGNKVHIRTALDWLCLAQDKNNDGGVAAWYSLIKDWGKSYIETTGYIIDTFLDCGDYFRDNTLVKRAINMADFIVNNQHESGGYRTHTRNHKEISFPTIFNTGQDLLGLTSIYKFTSDEKYKESFIKAANFLCSVQENNGSWVKFQYGNSSHVYDTRVAWGLLKVYQITKEKKFKQSCVKNLEWASMQQNKNGWFKNTELPSPNPKIPYTHTISYAMEGFLFSGILLKEERWIKIAQKAADKILQYFEENEFIPGTFDEYWQSQDKYTCLTGDAQISVVWLTLYKITKDRKYLYAAIKMNKFLKSTQDILTSNNNLKGAIKGSFPIFGDLSKMKGYCRMAYLNWATKFFIDALLLEQKLT